MPALVSQPSNTEPRNPFSLTIGRKRIAASYLARLAIATLVIIVWGLLSVNFVWSSWRQGAQEQASGIPASSSADVEVAVDRPTFRMLLQTARTTCPQDQPLLLLNDGSAANQLSDYFLYPRRVISINPGDHFGPADLDAHQGGCIATFGAQARVDPFRSRLDEITCASEGCLYLIKP